MGRLSKADRDSFRAADRDEAPANDLGRGALKTRSAAQPSCYASALVCFRVRSISAKRACALEGSVVSGGLRSVAKS